MEKFEVFKMNNKELKIIFTVALISILSLAMGVVIGISSCENMGCDKTVPEQIQSLEDINQLPPGMGVTCTTEGCQTFQKYDGLMVRT